MREIVHLQAGQCGNQIGSKFWEVGFIRGRCLVGGGAERDMALWLGSRLDRDGCGCLSTVRGRSMGVNPLDWRHADDRRHAGERRLIRFLFGGVPKMTSESKVNRPGVPWSWSIMAQTPYCWAKGSRVPRRLSFASFDSGREGENEPKTHHVDDCFMDHACTH